MNKLSVAQRASFEAQIKRTRDVNERNRLCVILAYDDGHAPDVISTILRLNRTSVFDYLREFKNEGKTLNDPKGGAERKLSDDQLQMLFGHLSNITYTKAKSICAHVEKTFGIAYSIPGIIHLLHSHGFVYKKPLKVPTRMSPEKQQEFIDAYKKLKEGLKEEEEIYFVDAVHPEYQSQSAFGWIKKGVRKTLQTTAKQERLHFIGALKLDGMKLISDECDTVGSAEMVNFFRKLEARSKSSKIYVILDNAKSNRNKDLEAYLKTSKIQLKYLPPYSPNLNPIERLWKIMRENTTYNKYYEKFEFFAQGVRKFFENFSLFQEILINRITDNFQKITLNPVRNSI
jgi:transposase